MSDQPAKRTSDGGTVIGKLGGIPIVVHPPEPNSLPAKRVRITPEPISQAEIDEVSELYRHMKRSALQTVRYMVKIGEKCSAMKERVGHGRWGAWVARNLPFNIRTATRAMQTYHRFKSDPGLLDDPEEFLAQIHGNEGRRLKDQSDVENKSDVTSEVNNIDKERYDEEDQEDTGRQRVRPHDMDADEWTGMELVCNLGRTLDEYIKQPIAETRKLVALVDAYNTLCARLELQAKELNMTLEQAIKGKRLIGERNKKGGNEAEES